MAVKDYLGPKGTQQLWTKAKEKFVEKESGKGLSTNDYDDAAMAEVAKIASKANSATTLSGYGITDAYSKTEADSAISTAVGQAVAGVYKVKGSVEFASLPTENVAVGDVYNITDAFTASSAFVTSEVGKEYPAGTNVCYTDNGWDAMAGTYDFSDFVMESDLQEISDEALAAILV